MKKTLLFLICAFSTIALFGQWSTDPTQGQQLTKEGISIYDFSVLTNDEGITYIHFTSPERANDAEANIASYFQILDKEGKMLFPLEGKKFSHKETYSWTQVNDFLFLDNEGNAIMCVSDCRNAAERGLSYSAYKISPQGELLWEEDGVDLDGANTYSLTANMKMTNLSDGSMVFAWSYSLGDNVMGIKLQRLSSEGEILWDEPILVSDQSTTHQYPHLMDAGNNQFLMLYSKGSNQDLMVRKFEFDGEAVWPEDVRIYRGGFGTIPLHTFLTTIPDGKGGMFIGWHDDRYFTNTESVFVSHIKSNGELSFIEKEGGQQVAYNSDLGLRAMNPKLVYDEESENLYILWREIGAGSQSWQRIMIQKMNMTGELLWESTGIEVYPLEQNTFTDYSIQTGPEGTLAVFFVNTFVPYQESGLFSVLIDGKTGGFVWDLEDYEYLSFGAEGSYKGGLHSMPLVDNKYWFTYWGDTGTLYGQRIFTDGTFEENKVNIAEIVVPENAKVYPTIITDRATFMVEVSESGMVSIDLYALSGQKVENIYQDNLNEGTHKIDWSKNNSNLAPGTYIAVITTPTGRYSAKVFIK